MKTLSEVIGENGILVRLPDYKREDCLRIQAEGVKMEIAISIPECVEIWQEWSDDRDAQWLCSGDSEEIQQAIRCYIEKRTQINQ